MKRIKRSVCLWTAAGIILGLLTLTVILVGINSAPAIVMDPQVLADAAAQTLDCVRTGDYDALGQMLYGAPNLGDSPKDTDDLENMILMTFLQSIRYRISPDCRASDSGISLDVQITCLDISALSESLQAIVPDLMNQIANEKGDESLVYDENHNYLDSFLDEVLRTAAQQALADEPQTMDTVLTLDLVQWSGRWQVVPTNAFVQLLCGYVSQ